MEEMIKENTLGQPHPEEKAFSQGEEDTTPSAPEDNAFLEVKFNKEIKKLNLEEAKTLAQKGMKLDTISEEIEALQGLAREKGIGLKDFVGGLLEERQKTRLEGLREKYSEDNELIEVLSSLDKKDPLSEIRKEIPDITEEAIPQEVKSAAEKSDKGLLFEYLLYEFRKNRAEGQEAARQEESRRASLGSLSSGGAQNTAEAEFLKGLWG